MRAKKMQLVFILHLAEIVIFHAEGNQCQAVFLPDKSLNSHHWIIINIIQVICCNNTSVPKV